MKIAILTLLLALSISLSAQESQIKFREFNSFKEIKAAAQKENKDIMLYFHYKGCGWCRKMETTTFTDSAVGEFYNQNFINVSLDFLKDSIGINMDKKGIVPPSAPAFVFMNSMGIIKHNEVGYRVSEDFIKVGQIASDPEANYSFFENKLANKYYSVETVYQIITKGPRRSDNDSLISCMIEFNKDKPEELYSEKSFYLIFKQGIKDDSPLNRFLIENHENFLKYTGQEAVENMYKYYWSWKINNGWFFMWNLDSRREKNKVFYADKGIDNYDKICSYADYYNALDLYNRFKKKKKKKFNKFINMADKYFAEYHDDWRAYSEASLRILETDNRFKTEENIERAKKWAEKAIELKEHPKSMYVYARLMKELDKKEEAIKVMRKVIKMSRKEVSNENYYYRDLATKYIKYWQES